MTRKFCFVAITLAIIMNLTAFSFASGKKTNSVVKPFEIYTPGTEDFVDYEKYGEFQNIGTDKYKYVPMF